MKPPDTLASKGRAVEEWTDFHFFRPVGRRIAGAASATRISADQVTMASLLVGLVAGHLFVYQSVGRNAVGLMLFIISDLLDSADGQLARLRGTSTRFGRVLDGFSDGARFLNLYIHLAVRLVLAGGSWPAAVLALAALFSHQHQSSAVDFIKNAFLRFHDRDHDALDLPEHTGREADENLFIRTGRGIYRDYLERQVRMFPQSVRLARRIGTGDLPAGLRVRYAEMQEPVVARCAWIGQNIRFAMLALTAVAGWPSAFLWLTLGPLNLVLIGLVATHERNARRLLAAMPRPVRVLARAERTYRGAIIGLGGIARQAHLPAFIADRRLEDRFAIVATVDAGEGVSPFDGIPLLRSMDTLREMGPIDFVDICTPTATHLPLTLQALAAGYHVVCEKPVALTRSEATQVARAAHRANRIVMPCHQHRFNPVWRQIARWLEDDALGRWHLAELSVYRAEADRGASNAETPWRGLWDHARGGVLLDHGTHFLYNLMDLAGPPAGVRAWTGQLRHQAFDVEDTAQLILEYPGRIATVFLSWAGHQRENRIRIIGERGVIEWRGAALTCEANGVVESVDCSMQSNKASYTGWFGDLFADFAGTLDCRDGDEYLADIARVAAVLEAAYASAASGGRAHTVRVTV
ncbi:MAG: Gfo/Idh/MocA family oxidoreductase [Gemmatimonadetes bacterium]|nr:Gfo/Idh/MocA family oxidoreductase [Gemmatimonadota bacterium]